MGWQCVKDPLQKRKPFFGRDELQTIGQKDRISVFNGNVAYIVCDQRDIIQARTFLLSFTNHICGGVHPDELSVWTELGNSE